MTPDARLVPAAVAAWLGAAVLIADPGTAFAAAGGLGAVLVVALAIALRTRGRPAAVAAPLALAAAVAGLVAVSVGVTGPQRAPDALTRLLDHEGTAVVELTAVPRRASGPLETAIVEGSLREYRGGGATVVCATPVLLFVRGSPDQAGLGGGIGARILAGVRLDRAEPGDDVAYLGSATDVRQVTPPPPLLAWASALRRGFTATAGELPGDGGQLLPGLAIGDDSRVPPDLTGDMRRSSLSHLTAVSGANCVVVVATILLLARRLPRVPRLGLAALALGGFVVLVTPQPSVLRAATMGLLVLVATARGRPGGGLPTLAATVVLLLVLDPWLSRDAGFALSTLATAGLLVLAAPATALLGRALPLPLAAALAVPACAQLACQPVLLLLDARLSLWSVPANLLAGPAAPLATLGGLAACLVLPWAPGLGQVLAAAAWAPAAWIAAVARFFAGQDTGGVPWPDGAGGLLLLAAISVTMGAALLRPAARRLGIVAVAALLAGSGAAAGAALGRSGSIPPDWRIASCDIGQGDASVLRGDGGRFALIDTGDNPAALERCLSTLGVRRISLLVLTHFDLDHVGAAPTLAGKVDELLVGPSDGRDADRLAATLAAGGAQVRRAAVGDSGRLGDLGWRVLWPGPGIPPGNGASVTIEATAPGLRALFLGDLGEEAQDALLRSAAPRPVDVVKVAHHGSADQSPRLYERIRASVGLISCGAGNDYGHPTARLLQVLADVGTTPLRTDLEGMLLVAPGPDGVRVWTERSPDRDPATAVGHRG
ncbi:ComEC/Rec2 family competence protein [Naasia aerilata]|uniref:Membrane protein n=1 Tax=Naasia aerilata TaxID=1162966 RepID=A0ABM8GEA3_9MICO|nr:ComEC/Rec2 family competence protein [Naasia aerilata]BDZ46618.1 membrane protein [Naasia aerilata]